MGTFAGTVIATLIGAAFLCIIFQAGVRAGRRDIVRSVRDFTDRRETLDPGNVDDLCDLLTHLREAWNVKA